MAGGEEVEEGDGDAAHAQPLVHVVLRVSEKVGKSIMRRLQYPSRASTV